MGIKDLIGDPVRWAQLLGWMTLAGLACGIGGPFGSYPANIFTRIVYWTALFWAGSVLLWPIQVLAIVHGRRRRIPPLLTGGIATLIGCIPLALLAAAGGNLFWPVHASAMHSLEWYCLTLLVAIPASAIMYRLEIIGRLAVLPVSQEAPSSAPSRSADASPVVQDIPVHLLEAALCLKMEDHHVRLYGAQHSTLHLAAMRDVVRKLGTQRGLQVHRSWWVARHAVTGAEEDGRSATLILTNGLRVPVARSRMALLRQHGWLVPAQRMMVSEA